MGVGRHSTQFYFGWTLMALDLMALDLYSSVKNVVRPSPVMWQLQTADSQRRFD